MTNLACNALRGVFVRWGWPRALARSVDLGFALNDGVVSGTQADPSP